MIFCIGDSFTAGDELPDWQYNENVAEVYPTSALAWPGLLSKKINKSVVNLGRGACGNTRVIKRALDLCIHKSAEIIIVAWTNPERIEIADDKGIWDSWAARNIDLINPYYRSQIIKWTAAHQQEEKIAPWYYANWLRQVIMLQKTFQAYQQKYIMLQSHVSEDYAERFLHLFQPLIAEIDYKYFLGWPYESMMDWTEGCPQGPGGHFLEQGHEIVADKVYEYIRDLGWVS